MDRVGAQRRTQGPPAERIFARISATVIRESGGDRSAVTGGTRVLSDRIVVRVSTNPGETFLDRMIALVEGTSRKKTPNEIALSILGEIIEVRRRNLREEAQRMEAS